MIIIIYLIKFNIEMLFFMGYVYFNKLFTFFSVLIKIEFDYKKSCQEFLKEIVLFSNEELKVKLINNFLLKSYNIELKFNDNNLRVKIGDLFYKKYLIDKLCFLEVEFEKLYNFYTIYNLDTEFLKLFFSLNFFSQKNLILFITYFKNYLLKKLKNENKWILFY